MDIVIAYAAERVGLHPDRTAIHRDDSVALDEAKFLERDLRVPELRRRSGVAFANVSQTVDATRAHVGVVELSFRACKDLEGAVAGLSQVHRDTFNVAALSVFRFFHRGNAVFFLLSETPFHPKVRSFLDVAVKEAPAMAPCEAR